MANPPPKRLFRKFSAEPTQPVPVPSTSRSSSSSYMQSSSEPLKNIGDHSSETLSSLSQSPSGRRHSTKAEGSGSTTKLDRTDSGGVFAIHGMRQLQVDGEGTTTSMIEGTFTFTQQVH